MYPNITKGVHNILLAENIEFKTTVIEVYNVVGERIIHQEILGLTMHQFDLSASQPGLYLVKAIRGSEVKVEKIIKH